MEQAHIGVHLALPKAQRLLRGPHGNHVPCNLVAKMEVHASRVLLPSNEPQAIEGPEERHRRRHPQERLEEIGEVGQKEDRLDTKMQHVDLIIL